MGTLQTWRKAYGALKDRTKVGLAHVNSDFKVSSFISQLNYLVEFFCVVEGFNVEVKKNVHYICNSIMGFQFQLYPCTVVFQFPD